MPTPSPPSEQSGTFLPILMILLGVALIGAGWIINDPTGEIQNEIGEVVSEIFDPVESPEQISEISNLATATTLVIVLPNGNQPKAAPVAPAPAPAVATPVAAAPSAGQIAAAPASAPAVATPVAAAPSAGQIAAAPVISPVISQATSVPVIVVTATLPPATATAAVATATQAAVAVAGENVSGHCATWTNGECIANPTVTPAPTYQPPVPSKPTATALPPTPTIMPTPLPENNSISSIVSLQGATKHDGTSVIVTNSNGVVTAHTTTNGSGQFVVSGLEKGSYQLAAYSKNGSHLPACTDITVGGNESIAIPQTMLSNGGGFNTDETMNIGAAALVAIQFGMTIPNHMVPILDVSRDGIVNETDANMLIADPQLLACQAW